ncbi:hypothetical protein SLS56_001036 [Neofusicoccum ribis]|uniref:Uncharacterized protein n=1 Tax=Neofusicoccum ribis TaxID=45134 RepID=A0ABR3TAS5_9PEZI
MAVMREQWLVQTGEGVVEDGQQWVDEDDEDDESDEEEDAEGDDVEDESVDDDESDEEDAEDDDVEDESVEDENELEDDEDEYEDEEIVTEGLTGPWVEQTGIGGGSPHEDEAPRPAKDNEGDEDNDSSIDGDEAFFDTREESAPSTSHSRSTSTQAASSSGQPTPSSRGAPSSTLPAATLQLITADHQSLVDASLAAGFDILDEEDTRRPMWDIDDIAPYHRRPLHAHRRSQHTQPHHQHESAVASTRTSNAMSAARQPQWMSASAFRPATSPNSTPTAGRSNLGTRVLARPPSPGSAGIAMISERSQDLPRSNVGRHSTRDNGRGDGVPTSSTSGSRR